MSRRDGWCGIAFVIGLLVQGAMVTLPTAAESGERIKAFYDANRQVIIAQQILGILLLVPFLALRVASTGARCTSASGRGVGYFAQLSSLERLNC